jgi:hypothetical protein
VQVDAVARFTALSLSRHVSKYAVGAGDGTATVLLLNPKAFLASPVPVPYLGRGG